MPPEVELLDHVPFVCFPMCGRRGWGCWEHGGGNRLVEQVWVLISGPLTWILTVKAPSSTGLTRAPESALHRDGAHRVYVDDGPPHQLAAFPSGIWDIKKE